jgi:hypothetical protein
MSEKSEKFTKKKAREIRLRIIKRNLEIIKERLRNTEFNLQMLLTNVTKD